MYNYTNKYLHQWNCKIILYEENNNNKKNKKNWGLPTQYIILNRSSDYKIKN